MAALGSPASLVSRGPGLSLPRFDSSQIALMREHFDECTTRHKRCYRAEPTALEHRIRLLEIGADNDSPIRLCTLERAARPPRYATLSHRWNQQQHGVNGALNGQTEAALRDGIAIDDLPRTYQLAVLLARAIGIRYLWIDALCIRQDLLEDWESYAPVIGEIFLDSSCNIALIEEDTAVHQVDDCSPILDDDSDGTDHTCSRDVDVSILRQVTPRTLPRQSKTLFDRGWAMQELLLSPCNIFVAAASQLYFHCLESRAGDSAPRTIHPLLVDPQMQTCRSMLRKKSADACMRTTATSWECSPTYTPPPEIHEHVHRAWQRYMEWYTACQLTYQSDRLNAIAAFAKRFGVVLREEYIFGLWDGPDLAYSLLWYVCASQPVEDRSVNSPSSSDAERCTVPTWSWAGVEAGVRWLQPAKRSELSARVSRGEEQTGVSRNGPTPSATLYIEGDLYAVPANGTWESVWAYGGSDVIIHMVGKWPVETLTLYLDTPQFTRDSSNCYFLPICKRRWDQCEENRIEIAGMIVRTSHGLDPDTYERLGIFTWSIASVGATFPLENNVGPYDTRIPSVTVKLI